MYPTNCVVSHKEILIDCVPPSFHARDIHLPIIVFVSKNKQINIRIMDCCKSPAKYSSRHNINVQVGGLYTLFSTGENARTPTMTSTYEFLHWSHFMIRIFALLIDSEMSHKNAKGRRITLDIVLNKRGRRRNISCWQHLNVHSV